MADDTIDVKIGGTIEGLTATLQAAQAQLEGLVAPIAAVQDAFSGMAEVFAGTLGVEKLIEFSDAMNDLGERAEHASEMLGMSVPQVTALQGAFRIFGMDGDAATMAMTRLERAASESQRGTGAAADAFQRLGISVTDASGHLKPALELLMEIADRFKDAPNDINKLDAAWALMGRSTGAMIPFLNQGREGIEQLMHAAAEAGTQLDTDLAKRMGDAAQEAHTLGDAMTGLGVAIEAKLGIWKNFVDMALAATESLTKFLNATNQAKLDNFFEQLTAVNNEIQKVKAELAEGGWSKFLTGSLETQLASLQKQFADLDAERARLIAAMKADAASGAGAGTNPIWAPAASGGTSTGSDSGAADQRALDEELNDELRERVRLIQSAASASAAYYNRLAEDAKAALATGRITSAEEYADLVAAENAKFSAIAASIAREQGLYKEDETEYGVFQDEKEKALQAHLAAMDKLETQYAQESKKSAAQSAQQWKEALSPVGTAFDQVMSGMLEKGETFTTALDKAFVNLATSFIEQVLKMIAQWLAFEALTAAFGTSLGIANPFAAGASGLGGLIGAGIASLDTGAWSIPRDMLAIVHQGEMVIPQAQAALAQETGSIRPFSSGAATGAGGTTLAPNFTFQIQTMDASGVAAWANANGKTIAGAVTKYLANNPSARGDY
jgi:hypothetical protein